MTVHPEAKLPSASISKLFTAYAALKLLGANFKFKTIAFVDKRKLKNGVLDAPLVIKGYGDPFLVSERLWLFAELIAASGLKHIKKGIQVDQSFFKDYPKYALKSSQSNSRSFPPYFAPVSPTAVNFNTVALLISRDIEKPEDFRVAALPFSDYVTASLQVSKRKGQEIRVNRRRKTKEGKLHIQLSGKMSQYKTKRLYESVHSPTDFFAHVMKQMLIGHGIQVDGKLEAYHPSTPIEQDLNYEPITFDSLPLLELVRLMILYSNNFMADSLVFAMGAGDLHASYEQGKEKMLSWLKRHGISIEKSNFLIGSGLSRKNKLSAHQDIFSAIEYTFSVRFYFGRVIKN